MRTDAAVNAGANVALAAVGVASGSFASYRFGPPGRGVLGVGQVLIGLGASLGCAGIGEALVHWRASGARFSTSRVVRYALVAALGGALLGLLCGWILSRWLPSGSGDFEFFAAISAGATAFYLVPLGLLRGAGRFLAWNAARTAGAVWWLVSLVVCALSDDLDLVVLGATFASGLAVLGAVLLFASTEPLHHASAPSPGLRSLLAFGAPAALASAPLLLNARIDQVALAPAVTSVELGQYVAAAAYCWAVVPVGQAIAVVAATRVAERAPDERAAVLRRLMGASVTAVAACGIAAWIVAGRAIPLLNGDNFGPAVGIARVLLIGATLQAITFICEEGAKGLGRPAVAMRAELAGVAVMAVALLVLVRHGLIPTAVASTTGYVASFVVAARLVSRAAEMSPFTLLRPSFNAGRSTVTRVPAAPTTSGRPLDEGRPGPPEP